LSEEKEMVYEEERNEEECVLYERSMKEIKDWW
jgi:hypothetical protein